MLEKDTSKSLNCSRLINKLIGGLTASMFCRVRKKYGLTCFFSSNRWGCCQSIFLPTYSLMTETRRKGSWFNLKSDINKLIPIYHMLYSSYHSIKILLDNTGSTHMKNWSTRSTNKPLTLSYCGDFKNLLLWLIFIGSSDLLHYELRLNWTLKFPGLAEWVPN